MEEKKKGFFSPPCGRSHKDQRKHCVRNGFHLFSGFSAIDDDFYEELEETLIMGDMGIQTTMAVIEDLKEDCKRAAYQGSGAVPVRP